VDRAIPDVRVDPGERLSGRRPGQTPGHGLTVVGVRFEGRLRILDLDRFRAAIATGIGPGKAYGCGLLSIAPRRPDGNQGSARAAGGPG
jgi:CRISPR system Cascade subunit CasE